MKSNINFTAIIAVAMIAMSVLVLGSCNADDDYDNYGIGTLANGMMTRAGENQSQPKTEIEYISDTTYTKYTVELESECPAISEGLYKVDVDVMIYQRGTNLYVELINYNLNYSASHDKAKGPYRTLDINLFNLEGVYFEEDAYPHDRYHLCARGTNEIGVTYKGSVKNRLFFAL